MSALKVLDLAQQQGLLEERAADELRTQVAMSPKPISADDMTRLLVEQGHLTRFQASKLLERATGQKEMVDLLESPTLADSVDDDDVVLLEAVEPEEPPKPLKQPEPSAPAKSAPPGKPPRKPERPPAVTAPIDLADPSTELVEPVADKSRPAKPRTSSRPKPDPQPAGDLKPVPTLEPIAKLEPVGGLEPIGSLEPLTPLQPIGPASLSPLQPLGPEPLTPVGGDLLNDPMLAQAGLTPLDPLGGQSQAPAKPAPEPKKKRNQWDSPFLLIGGGIFGALVVVFGLLYFSLTRGSAAEAFAQAEAEYNAGAYGNAIAAYDNFLKRHPQDPNASLARVRRGIAQIRSVSDSGRDPATALSRASEVLPQLEKEEAFNEARVELAQILPTIAEGFADRARDTGDLAQREALVAKTEESMALVTNPSYVPSSIRKDIEGRLSTIVEKLNAAKRSISEDKELETALAQMEAAAKAGNAAEGYEIRRALLRKFPKVSAEPALIAATRAVTERERELVQVSTPGTAATTDDAKPASLRVLIADREGQTSSAPAGQRAFRLLEGAVYGIDFPSGQLAWRRYVGRETTLTPAALQSGPDSDAIASDARTHAVLRLAGDSGKLVWRQELGERFFTPVVAGEWVFVSTASGRLLQIAAGDGAIAREAKLPQALTSPACVDTRGKRLYQLGEHSTVFAFDLQTLACEETYYLGHTAGSILAPPVLVLDHLLIPQSPTDEYSLVHALKPAGEERRLSEAANPFRLTGRIAMPLSTSGRRAVAVTDLGQISVFEVDPAAEKQAIRELARVAASDTERTTYFHTIEGSQLWVGGRRLSMYEVQGSLQQLSRVWSAHQDDAFIAPVTVAGKSLLHVRRRPNLPSVIVEACSVNDGKTQWRTDLATPIVATTASEARAQLVAITAAGRVFEVSREALAAGALDKPTQVPPAGTGRWYLTDQTPVASGRIFASGFERGSQALLYDVAAEKRVKWLDVPLVSREATSPPTAYQDGVLVPLKSGRVVLISPETGAELMLPFQPELQAGVSLAWPKPTTIPPDGDAAVLSDGVSRLFRIGRKGEPQPHLQAAAQANVEGSIKQPLASTGDAVYAVTQSATGETLRAFQPGNLSAGQSWPLVGACSFGPVAVDGRVFVADTESLYCFGPGQQTVWKAPLAAGPVSALPILKDGDWIVVHSGGRIRRLSAETGEELATVDVGEPLGAAASTVGQRLLVGGVDGVMHLVPLPRRQ